MSLFETCAKLAAYLVCIGIALEFSHKLYWRVNAWILTAEVSTFSRSALSSVVACIPLGAAFFITFAFVRLVDQGSLASLGLTYDGESLTMVAYGAAIAFGCVTLIVLMGVVGGFIQIKRSPVSEDCVTCLPVFMGGLADFFTSAVFEEIIIRGYVFFILYEASGPAAAVLGSSVIFSLAHLLRHSKTPLIFTLNALMFGLITAGCRYYTGALWLPIGLHFGWNVAAGPLFGLPYSGRAYDRGVVVSEVSGPEWLTGGFYSPDAGLVGTAALLIAAVGLMAVAPIA